MPWIGLKLTAQFASSAMKKLRYTLLVVVALCIYNPIADTVLAQQRVTDSASVNDPLEQARQFIRKKRYADAYDLLQSVREQYGNQHEWMRLTVEVDDYFVRAKGRSLLFPIDRLTYKVKVTPNDSKTRYELVDALMQSGRFYEAEEHLEGQRYINAQDPEYLRRKNDMATRKASLTSQKIAQLQAKVAANPRDGQALRELAYFEAVSGSRDAALATYQRALTVSSDPELRYEYADLLMSMERYDMALPEVEALIAARPTNLKYKNLYASITLFSGKVTDKTEQYLMEALRSETCNVDILANMSLLKVYQGKLDEADQYARRAQTCVGSGFSGRLEQLDQLIAESKRTGGRGIGAVSAANVELERARQLSREQKYFDAADAFELYFRKGGPVKKEILAEMANAIADGGDPESAIGVLQRALVEQYDPELVLRIAQLRYDMNDYAGAIAVLEELMDRGHKQKEAYRLLGDAYAKARWFGKSREAYNMALAYSPDDPDLRQRIGWATPGVGKSGSYDYAALLIPFVRGISAKGFETTYEALAMGISSQVTLPIPVVLTAGFTSGGNKGTAFQSRPGISDPIKNPDGDKPLGYGDTWYNQVSLGAFIDLTKPEPYRFYGHNYSNRIAAEGGLVDYAGGRTVPFGAIRYYHQTKNVFRLSLGAERQEGSTALWSPAGAQNELVLYQLGGDLGTPHGQKLLFNAAYSYNIAKDKFGENKGMSIGGDLGYKTFRNSWIGASYYTINYDNKVNFYFSPTNWSYQEVMAWLLHEREMAEKYYVRFKVGPGMLLNNDFAFGRGELDVIYKFAPNIGIGLMGRITQSFRYRNKLETNPYNTYQILVGGVNFYWTL